MLKIHQEAADVDRRLAELGLNPAALAVILRRGWLAYASCTKNDPPLFPGFSAWAMTVRALREYLLPQGWDRVDDNNYSLTVNPIGSMAIVVATGDDATGRPDASPTTKSSKGPSTADAVASNQQQLEFPFAPFVVSSAVDTSPEERRMTWIFLVHRGHSEVRAELSLPTSMATDGKPSGWRERILLGSISLDPEVPDIVPPENPAPDIEIDVKRRA